MKSPIASVEEVVQAAERIWFRFLQAWIRQDTKSLFPMPLRVRLAADPNASAERLTQAVNRLHEHSKAVRGFGYSITYGRKRSHLRGEADTPIAVQIDTAEDLVALLGLATEFRRTKRVVSQVRKSFPELELWLASRAERLTLYADEIDDLIVVGKYLVSHPNPDCYLRQLPLPVDTEFVTRHERLLSEWLDVLLPPELVKSGEKSFARRFGFRDGELHHLVRILDSKLLAELGLPTDEMSAPLRFWKTLKVKKCNVLIVEDSVNLLTLPSLPRTLALQGFGLDEMPYRELPWLASNRLVYWGNLDVEGFRILAVLRGMFKSIASFAMDKATLDQFSDLAVTANGGKMSKFPELTDAENQTLARCSKRNLRLAQGRIPQSFVESQLPGLVRGLGKR